MPPSPAPPSTASPRRLAALLACLLLLPALLLRPGLEAQPPAAAAAPARAAAPSSVASSALADALAAEVAKGRRSVPSLGVHVVEIATGEPVYGYREDEPLVIASNAKLITTAAALDRLGPGHFFETRFLVRGEVDDGVLRGDLGVVGGGDPAFSDRDWLGDPFGPFRAWTRALRERGVTRVEGDLILDHGFFADPLRHPDWDSKKNLRWYQVPIDALGYNENVLELRARPAERAGEPAEVEIVHPLPFYEIDGSLRTVGSRSLDQPGVRRVGSGGEVEVYGGIYRGVESRDFYAAVPDPVVFFGVAFVGALAEAGVELGGSIRPVEKLPGLVWEEVAVHRTPLLEILLVTNRESQNFYAESVLKLLGAEVCGQGSWERGIRAVEAFLEEAGIPPESYHLADGSGLSRENRFSASQFTRLLRYMAGHPLFEEYLGTLPHGGQDRSSLKKRLDEPPYSRAVRAKTGTLDGISTLSGYARGRSGRLYAFSVLANRSAAWRARDVQDAIVRAIVDHG